MTAEEGTAEEDATFVACDPPRRLVLDLDGPWSIWRLTAELAEHDGVTTLTFTHRLGPGHEPSELGPGWEYYLDRLVASQADQPMPPWDAYLALAEHYRVETTDR
jgi:hypothetical protein